MKNRIQNKLFMLLPFAFLLHNLEEALFAGKYPNTVMQRLVNPEIFEQQFRIMLLTISILAFIIPWLLRKSKNYRVFINGFAGLLFLNVITHSISVFIFKTYIPGIVTGLLVILPLTYLILKRNHKRLRRQVFYYSLICGIIIGAAIIFSFIQAMGGFIL